MFGCLTDGRSLHRPPPHLHIASAAGQLLAFKHDFTSQQPICFALPTTLDSKASAYQAVRATKVDGRWNKPAKSLATVSSSLDDC
jgi:hypothetical protein